MQSLLLAYCLNEPHGRFTVATGGFSTRMDLVKQ